MPRDRGAETGCGSHTIPPTDALQVGSSNSSWSLSIVVCSASHSVKPRYPVYARERRITAPLVWSSANYPTGGRGQGRVGSGPRDSVRVRASMLSRASPKSRCCCYSPLYSAICYRNHYSTLYSAVCDSVLYPAVCDRNHYSALYYAVCDRKTTARSIAHL